ncbi:hypothetical protein I350_00636 [Cryptococcus amylolentus CBS 6273]|uniref:Uncharacterized protein n=1 Tax=Cryptococcus amylolentus CBS 6273 TaxID=1296118 RepID=A0A1E3KHQ7_9TREE|nr:hypothetical protein I350_00636 [Cryptococcus amylolentus CBS 6273]
MVRFKNRYLLVEFLVPGSLSPSLTPAGPSDLNASSTEVPAHTGDEDESEDEDELLPIPTLPFMLPVVLPELKTGDKDEGGQVVYRAIKNLVLSVFGDEGWGRIASSFRVIYHSPLTTLTFIRIARHHYRLLWSAITLLTTLGPNNVPIIPRVLAVSGTIKKLQNTGTAYHRAVVGQLVSAGVSGAALSGNGGLNWGRDVERERQDIGRLQKA